MDELTPPERRDNGGRDVWRNAGRARSDYDVADRGGRDSTASHGPDQPVSFPHSGDQAGTDGSREDLPFARVLGIVGIAILALSGLLLALPSYLRAGPAIYLVAYGIAILFGPVGFWLMGEAWRIRNRAVHGTTLPAGQRRGLRILGAALIAVGVFVAFSGFGASGTISMVLNLVWGLMLAGYGVRMLLRTLGTERA